MDKYGLIGHPIDHSASPQLFRTAYGGRLQYELIEGKYFEESLSRFKRGYKAINVTAPFKEKAFEQADIVSGPSVLIGAANILVNTPEGICCHNSDFTGIILAVAQTVFPGIISEFYELYGSNAYIKIHQFLCKCRCRVWGSSPEAVIVGCGGAGKAAAVAAAEMGFHTTILNRTVSTAAEFAKGLKEYSISTASLDDFALCVGAADLVIYTLPVALPDMASLWTAKQGKRILLEANYRDPSITGLTLARARDAGFDCLSGMSWLVCQAISGYAVMTGESPDVEALLELCQ